MTTWPDQRDDAAVGCPALVTVCPDTIGISRDQRRGDAPMRQSHREETDRARGGDMAQPGLARHKPNIGVRARKELDRCG